jgi:membrane-bound serine protease (ClpP class)
MHTLPVNYAGLALIIFALILFLLEIKVVSHGVLTIGGIISLLLGSMMLIDEDSVLEAMEISMELIIIVVVLTAGFFLFAITFGIRAQRKKPVTGSEGIIGEIGTAIVNIKPLGKVRVHGEIWNAECKDEVINKGDEVEVVSVNHLTLIVEKRK